MHGSSLPLTDMLLKQLQALVPAAFIEGKIDIIKLQKLLGNTIQEEAERYQLNWIGKNEAYKNIQETTNATLLPFVDASIHWDTANNIFIEGENLEVLKILQKSYFEKIDFITIDPPYNTGTDNFIYNDNFSDKKETYLKKAGAKNEEGFMVKEGIFKPNKKENGHFHSNWLSMMLPRLHLARNLLTKEGVISIHIDANESHAMKLLLDEVFGEENFVTEMVWKKKGGSGNTETTIGTITESIFVYAKNIATVKINKRAIDKDFGLKDDYGYYTLEGIVKTDAGAYKRDTMKFGIYNKTTKETIYPPEGKRWTIGEKTKQEYLKQNLLAFVKDKQGNTQVKYKKYLTDAGVTGVFLNLLIDKGSLETAKDEIAALGFDREVFDTPKPTLLIEHLLSIFCNKKATVLDFFGGSGTTAHAVMNYNNTNQTNLQFILVQLPEQIKKTNVADHKKYNSISSIAYERIKRVIHKLEIETKEKIGVRLFKLAPSNFKIWQANSIKNEADIIKQLLQSSKQKIEHKYEAVWELLIKNGHPLSYNIKKTIVSKKEIFESSNNEIVFLTEGISPEIITFIMGKKPKKVFAFDGIFKGKDADKNNFAVQMKRENIFFKSI
jgi:adenine-specific DNA-methyltransferase